MSTQDFPTPSREFRYYGVRPAWQWIDLAEVWRFRELIWMFALRDLKVRYRQTVVGIAWAVLQPLATMVIFWVLFQLLRGKPTASGLPYAVTSLCGLLPWQFFAASVTNATLSLVENQNLIQKVYFPRVILPVSSMIPALVDFCFAFVLLIGLMFFYGVTPTWTVVLLPFFLLLGFITALAVAMWLSALNAIYRDIQYVVPFVMQIGMFISPVVYEMDAAIPQKWQWLYSLNPMVSVLEGFRWTLLGMQPPAVGPMLVSFAGVALVFVSGTFYFRRMERFFSDRI
ncbi:MAG: phosphate ABC transporter permease [Planctomyces sp.]|nr:phosphate ABC transporter permease [Planctomyces sp.]